MRALTAVAAVVGTPPTSVHVFGSSITGSMSYSLALYDDRISSTGGTGAYGGLEDFLAQPRCRCS